MIPVLSFILRRYAPLIVVVVLLLCYVLVFVGCTGVFPVPGSFSCNFVPPHSVEGTIVEIDAKENAVVLECASDQDAPFDENPVCIVFDRSNEDVSEYEVGDYICIEIWNEGLDKHPYEASDILWADPDPELLASASPAS